MSYYGGPGGGGGNRGGFNPGYPGGFPGDFSRDRNFVPPNYGRDDLNPYAPHMDPLRGQRVGVGVGGGGGMIMDPRDLVQPRQDPYFQGGPVMPPGSIPPGARYLPTSPFDPYDPFQNARPAPGGFPRYEQGPRGPGYGPDYDHMRPPY